MRERRLGAACLWRLIFFVFTVIVFFVVPWRSSGGVIERSSTYWPFSLLSDRGIAMLSDYRTWFIGQWIVFSGTLLVLELFCMQLHIERNRVIRVIAFILFAAAFLSLLYFSIGSLVWSGPLVPMDAGTWNLIFRENKVILYVWWGVSALFFQLAAKM